MNGSSRLRLVCLSLPLVLSLSSCGDGVPPSGPSGGSGGTPTPTATPTATPAATPTPTPTTGLTCQLPERPDCGNNGCCDEGGSPLFNAQINDAQADLERTRRDIFNNDGSLRVDELEYTDILARKITQLFGLCAVGGGRGGNSRSKDEVGIKSDNNVSQNVDVIIGSSHTPYIGGRYTCRPASF
jgi:hypothetical protein